MKRYWLAWFVLTFPVGFLVPETIALVRGRVDDTLSGAIWQLEQFKPGQPVSQWTAFHLLFIAVLGVLFIWLFFHFGEGWWR